MAQREHDEAARLTASAYDIATATGSPRIMRYVTDIQQQLRLRSHPKAISDLREHLPPGE
jgi:hypothetical protein